MNEGYRLSPQQKQIWLWLTDNDTYKMQYCLLFESDIVADRMQQAIEQVVQRHTILRTRFEPVPALNFPIQVIDNKALFSWQKIDLTAFAQPVQAKKVETILASDLAQPVQLESGDLLQVSLLILSPSQSLLVLTTPALCADACSFSNITHEILAFYQGQEPSHPEEELVQFIQFADWRNSLLEDEDAEEGFAYWEQHDVLEKRYFQLPFQTTRQSSFVPQTIQQDLSSQALLTLASQQDMSLEDVLLATWLVLLIRLSEEDEVVIGKTVHGRLYEELDYTIGPLAASLPFSIKFSEGITFQDVLEQIKQTTAQIEEWEEYFIWSRHNTNEVGFFPYGFEFNQFHTSGSNLSVSLYSQSFCSERFWLKLGVTLQDNQIRLAFQYDSNQFAKTHIHRLATRYESLLQDAIQYPNKLIHTLEVMGVDERTTLLKKWNDTSVSFEPSGSIHGLIEKQADAYPARIAIQQGNTKLTYQQLNEQANQVAYYLRERGVETEDKVVLLAERSVEMIIGLLGILKAGGVSVPLDPQMPTTRLASMLTQTTIKYLLAESVYAELGRSLMPQTAVLQPNTFAQYPTTKPQVSINPNQLAYTIFTSGSSGKPKGVALEHQQIIHYTQAITHRLQIQPQWQYATISSISADLGYTAIYPALVNGGTLHILPLDTLLDPLALGNYFEQYQIDLFKTTPSHFTSLLKTVHPQNLFPRQALILGGEASTVQWIEQLSQLQPACRIYNHYGPTETCVGVLTHCYDPKKQTMYATSMSIPVGKPLPNTQVYLLDAMMQPVPIGNVGEIYIGGVNVARGYINAPALTALQFVPNPFNNKRGERLYRTGDLARFNERGELVFLGRADDQVKVRGYRIETSEIETQLQLNEMVQQTAVIPYLFESGEVKLVAYVVPKSWHASQTQNMATEQVAEWSHVFDSVYGQISAETVKDPRFDYTGWNSSYTGQPMLLEEIEESVNGIVTRIQSFQPQNILEIGCGTGLLLFRLLPSVTQYIATDLSSEALFFIEEALKMTSAPLSKVTLLPREATNYTEIPSQSIDMVILNSTIQYFPSVDYLLDVITGAVDVVTSGGVIFIGDIRHVELVDWFHKSVQFYIASPESSIQQVKQRAKQKAMEEKELILAPAFFEILASHIPQISSVEIQLKRGHHHNELTKYRYDALLHIGDSQTTQDASVPWYTWNQQVSSVSDAQQIWAQATHPTLGLSDVPNLRLSEDRSILELLDKYDDETAVAHLRERYQQQSDGVDPETWWQLAEQLGCQVMVRWAKSGKIDYYDVILYESTVHPIIPTSPSKQAWETYTNNPLRSKFTATFTTSLRQFLEEKIPSYMLPSTFVTLEKIPLLPNGKIDRTQLPSPFSTLTVQETDYVAPTTPIEEAIAQIWADVLRMEKVSIDADFFKLGGHSLMIAQIAYRVNDLYHVNIPLRVFFEEKTVAQLAQTVASTLIYQGDDNEIENMLAEISELGDEDIDAIFGKE